MNISSNVFISESWLWSIARSKIQHYWIDVSPVDDAHFQCTIPLLTGVLAMVIESPSRSSTKKFVEITHLLQSTMNSMSLFWLHDISWSLYLRSLWWNSLRSWNLSLRQQGPSFVIPPSLQTCCIRQRPCIAVIAMQARRAFNFFSGARFSSSAYSSIHRNHGCQKIFFSWQRSKHFWIGHVA